MPAGSLLSPLQGGFLNRFFTTTIGQSFFLTGGTALSEFWLAGMLRQAETLSRLPVMLKPLELDALKSFYLNLADDLLRQIKPGD